MKKTLLLLPLIFAFLLVGCSEEIENKLIVVDYVVINVGSNATINIHDGSLLYQITSSDNSIATACL